ncbi:MAG: SBBP repeat-containing protein [Planctomycetota bacterium]
METIEFNGRCLQEGGFLVDALRARWVSRGLLIWVLFSSPVVAFLGVKEAPDPAATCRVECAEEATLPVAVSSQAGSVQDETVRPAVLEAFRRLPLAFVENLGQLDRRVAFSTRKGSPSAYFTKDAIVLRLTPQKPVPPRAPSQEPGREDGEGANIFLTFEEASSEVAIEGCEQLPGRYNYLLGSDPSKWYRGAASFASIRYRGLYPGVDMVVRDGGSRLEYDLLLEPGVDDEAITVRCDGAESLRLGEDGALILETAAGPLRQPRPCTYELGPSGTRQPVECSYRLLGDDRFGFHVPTRNHDRALVIDPGLVFGTFLGGAESDGVEAVALDASGRAVMTGWTTSSDFPTTPGAYDASFEGDRDAVVVKLSADGSTLLYATFLGGSDSDAGKAIALDSSGVAWVAGWTESPDFPASPGAFDGSYNGSEDAFVAKLSADGSSLLYGTFLGGGSWDEGCGIAVNASGAAFVGGWTFSYNFPATPGAYDTSFNGYCDAFVAKLSADGASLVYATFLGGSNADYGYGIALDPSGAGVLTGWTVSSDFPATLGAYDPTYNGGSNGDAFVVKLNAGGWSLLYGTFLGGSASDWGDAVALDPSGAALVTGWTTSSDFPTTPGAYDASLEGESDAFVAKLNADGSSLVCGTFLGGSSSE